MGGIQIMSVVITLPEITIAEAISSPDEY